MLNEQELAEQEIPERDADEAARDKKAKADADAVLMTLNSTDSNLEQALERGPAVTSADAMELCSATELAELFAEYTEADQQQLQQDFLVSDSRTLVDLDFDHPALRDNRAPADLVAHAVVNENDEEYDLNQFVSKD